ncbi:hypothetical protein D3C71_2012930 [compost metagenome]
MILGSTCPPRLKGTCEGVKAAKAVWLTASVSRPASSARTANKGFDIFIWASL